MKKQIKKFEIKLFDELAKTKKYETAPKSFYRYLATIFSDNDLPLKGRALEAGCGSGTFGRQILKLSKNLTIIGVDISPMMVKRANEQKGRYKAIRGDLEDASLFKADSFDLIFCALVLHHFPNLKQVFRNFKKWGKPGSYIVIIEPNSQNIIGALSKISRSWYEFIFGGNYLVAKGFATPNEVDHPLKTYISLLKANDYRNFVIKSGYVKPDIPITFSLGGFKTIFTHLSRFMIPFPQFTDNFILIIAEKSNATT